MTNKSPFFIENEFLSPYLCEELIDIVGFNVPDANKEGDPILTVRSSERAEAIVYERLLNLMPKIEKHFELMYKGTEEGMTFEWYPETTKGQFLCGNSKYVRQKWLRINNRDLTGVIFLCDYQDKLPFEQDFEVYGGKLEFVQHRFGFNPSRGTLIVFPADPHFINITTEILAGDLFQVRFFVSGHHPYFYQPSNFPGNYTTWFKDVA
jgi:hypothetical protein